MKALLSDELKPYSANALLGGDSDRIFQQDNNDPKHTSKVVCIRRPTPNIRILYCIILYWVWKVIENFNL